MHNTFTRIHTCALAAAAVLFFGGQASAQPFGGPNVTVANTPLPVTVTNPSIPGTPVAFLLRLPVITGTTDTFAVPAGQRLVIEYVSGLCGIPGTLTTAFPLIESVTSGGTVAHAITMPSGSIPAIQGNVEFGQLVKIYADPGTNVTLHERQAVAVTCALIFSGLLVNTH